MDINEILDLLGLDTAEEFSHFEDFAGLLECDKMVSYEAVHEILSKADKEDLIELITGYFDEVTENLPGDNLELFTILSTISKMLIGLLENEEEEKRNIFIDEMYRFKNWYTFESEVECTSVKNGELLQVSLCEAIYMHRLEKIEGAGYRYDCSQCLDYELEEYTLSFSATIDTDNHDEREDRYEEEEDDKNIEFLIDPTNPVIDGEFEDDIEDEL